MKRKRMDNNVKELFRVKNNSLYSQNHIYGKKEDKCFSFQIFKI